MDVQDARLKRHAPWLMALLTLIWGTNWPVIALAVREVSAWTFRALTLPVAGILLLLLAHRRKLPLAIPRQHWPMLLCSAWAFLALWNVATTLALTYIPSGQAALLGFTMPLWAALWSWLLFGHTLDGRQWLALLLGTAGVIVLMIPAFASYAHAPLGLVYGLASGAGWALSTVLLKHRPIPVPTTVLTASPGDAAGSMVSQAQDGLALRLNTAEDAAGIITVPYTADDGRGLSVVTVEVVLLRRFVAHIIVRRFEHVLIVGTCHKGEHRR